MSPEERESLLLPCAIHAMRAIINTNPNFVLDPENISKKSFEFATALVNEYDSKLNVMKGVNK